MGMNGEEDVDGRATPGFILTIKVRVCPLMIAPMGARPATAAPSQ